MLSFYIFVLFTATILGADGCYFRNCPNDYTYTRKRSSPSALSKAKFLEAIPDVLKHDIEDCPEKGTYNNVCDFAGSKVCCSVSEDGEILCSQKKTSQDIDFISKDDMDSAEEILQNYVAIQSYNSNSEAKFYCVNIGICCQLGNCLTHATCDWQKKDILQSIPPYSLDVAKMKSLNPTADELAKLLRILRKLA